MRAVSSLTQTHLNVSGRTYICANMAADALVVVGSNIASKCRFSLLDAIHGSLRAIHHTIVALEAHAATHATLGLRHRLLLVQHTETILEVAQRAFLVQRDHPALVTRHVGKMPEEQLVVRDDVAVG